MKAILFAMPFLVVLMLFLPFSKAINPHKQVKAVNMEKFFDKSH